jgi:hypothetical protein
LAERLFADGPTKRGFEKPCREAHCRIFGHGVANSFKVAMSMQNPFRNTTFQVHFHKWATLVWIALTIPTLLVWKESIL